MVKVLRFSGIIPPLLFSVGLALRPPFWLVGLALRFHRNDYAANHSVDFFERRQRRKAILAHATALLGAGRFESAAQFILGLVPEDYPDAATWHYLAANALAGTGEFDRARAMLDRCLTIAPQYLPDVAANPLLQRLVNERGSLEGPEGYS